MLIPLADYSKYDTSEVTALLILVLTDEHLMHILQEISGIYFLIFSAKILKK